MDMTDRLVAALDLQQPDWWIRYVDQQDMRHFIQHAKDKDYARLERTIASRKRSLAGDLCVVVRAAVEAGIVSIVEDKTP